MIFRVLMPLMPDMEPERERGFHCIRLNTLTYRRFGPITLGVFAS
jgi:hypothetical protein